MLGFLSNYFATPWTPPEYVFVMGALALSLTAALFVWRRYRRVWQLASLLTFSALVTFMALRHMHDAAALERERRLEALEVFARIYAHEIEVLGHAQLTTDTEQQDPAYLAMIAAENRWLKYNPDIADIYTLRYKGPGAAVMIVDSETDFDRDGRFNTRTEQRTPIGFPFNSPDPAVWEAFAGKPAHSATPYRDSWGTWISSYIPIYTEKGQVDAVLAVNYHADAFAAAQINQQWTVFFEHMLVLLGGMGSVWLIVSIVETKRRIELAEIAKRLRVEKELITGLVNSLQAVVWERDMAAGRFTMLSQQAEGFLGFKLGDWQERDCFWKSHVHPEDSHRVTGTWRKLAQRPEPYHIEYRVIKGDGTTAWIAENGSGRNERHRAVLSGIFIDMTLHHEAKSLVEEAQHLSIEAARQAGMAELANGVLHNVGNVLNSLNVGAKLLADQLRTTRLEKLCHATALLREHMPSDPDFFTNDRRGKALPGYVAELSVYLRDEQNRLLGQVSDMVERIDHIRDVIMLQQSHGCASSLWESLDIQAVVEDALRLERDNLRHQGVEVERHISDVPPVYLARGLLLQILVNLISNACDAVAPNPPTQRCLVLRIGQHAEHVRIVIEDNGCGIQERHLIRIFSQGFTTKKDGHGFGLHHASLLAQEMGGNLKAESGGVDQGSRFILELPIRSSRGRPGDPAVITEKHLAS